MSLYNANGLTFERWYRAANVGRKRLLQRKVARAAWRKGVDPSEYAGRRPNPLGLSDGEVIMGGAAVLFAGVAYMNYRKAQRLEGVAQALQSQIIQGQLSTGTPAPTQYNVTSANAGQQLSLKVGDTFTATLPAAPTPNQNGGDWSVNAAPAGSIAANGQPSFANGQWTYPMKASAPGTITMTFAPTTQGNTQSSFTVTLQIAQVSS